MGEGLTAAVRSAFAVRDSARLLPGGDGTTWQVGDVVLKPVADDRMASWCAGLFAGLAGPGFRVPRPRRTADGAWVADGWAAWEWVEGEPTPVQRWPQLVAACRAVHAALAGIPAPGWLARRDDRWAVADRVAWQEASVALAPELQPLIDVLERQLRLIGLPSQLIHGDIAGNMLFAQGQPPAVIDFSPYWRPAGYALAIAAVDVLLWSGASPAILDALDGEAHLDQMLARALCYRLVTESLGRADRGSRQAVHTAAEPVVDLVLGRLSGRRAAMGFLGDAGLARLVAEALGRPVAQADVSQLGPGAGGRTRAVRRIVRLDEATSVFVKAAGPGAGAQLLAELDVYGALGAAEFLPRVLASSRRPVPMLILEALSGDGWVAQWTPQLVTRTRALLDRIHDLPAPAGLRRLADPAHDANPWEAIAADPLRLLRLQVCEPAWLDAHLDELRAAAAGAPAAGAALVHLDVHAANLWQGHGRLVLVDWAAAAVGDPWLDHHTWLVFLHAEGGPPPEAQQGPHAAGHAALIAGQQPLLTPSHDANPVLFAARRRCLTVALGWAARLLGIAPPRPVGVRSDQ